MILRNLYIVTKIEFKKSFIECYCTFILTPEKLLAFFGIAAENTAIIRLKIAVMIISGLNLLTIDQFNKSLYSVVVTALVRTVWTTPPKAFPANRAVSRFMPRHDHMWACISKPVQLCLRKLNCCFDLQKAKLERLLLRRKFRFLWLRFLLRHVVLPFPIAASKHRLRQASRLAHQRCGRVDRSRVNQAMRDVQILPCAARKLA